MKTDTRENIQLAIIIIFIVWFTTTNIIQAFKCPRMTQTELFLHIPKSFILNFNECK